MYLRLNLQDKEISLLPAQLSYFQLAYSPSITIDHKKF